MLTFFSKAQPSFRTGRALSYTAIMVAVGGLLVAPFGPSRAAVAVGDEPVVESAVATGGGAGFLLVSSFQCALPGCEFENAVLRYDAATGAFLGVHIDDISGPYGMALRPGGGTMLVVSRAGNLVNEYDARTGTFIRTFITAGPEGLNAPQSILFKADGNLLVSSTQTQGFLDRVNGLLEFDGTSGAFVRVFVDGGSILANDCGAARCLHGPNGMALGPNGHLYVASGQNNQVLEYDGLTGVYLDVFDSTKLVSPSGLAIRPAGTPRAGNILVTSTYRDPANPNDFDDVLEFDKDTHELRVTGGGIFATGMVNPGPLFWHSDGSLLVSDRALWNVFPFNSDRIIRRDGVSGAFIDYFTPEGDTHLHFATAMLAVRFGVASGDRDKDQDVDLFDYGAFGRCFGPDPTPVCLEIFDDNEDDAIDQTDYEAFVRIFRGPQTACTDDAECDDGRVCTDDACVDGACQRTPLPNGTPCADDVFCDGDETCQSGSCAGVRACVDQDHCDETDDRCYQCLTVAECDDDDPCTDDACDLSTGCQHVDNSAPCDDGDECTTNDTCSAGACIGGPLPNCDDADPCTDDSCNSTFGCLHTHNLEPCEDGNPCTLGDECLLGVCRAGATRGCEGGGVCDPRDGSCTECTVNNDCNDHNTCTFEACINGACQRSNSTDLCDDGLLCTVLDQCENGFCVGIELQCANNLICDPVDGVCKECLTDVDCDDGNGCTDDVCNAGTCENPNNTAPCDDGDPCTFPDACANGACQSGAPVDCSTDGGPCNTAACDPNGAEGNCDTLTSANEGLACEGTDPCTVGETCQTGVCTGGSPPDCSGAGDECNTASCDSVGAAGNCDVLTPANEGVACDDGLFCTTGDLCTAGECTGAGGPCAPTEFCDEINDDCVVP